jgi:hypothetical protein
MVGQERLKDARLMCGNSDAFSKREKGQEDMWIKQEEKNK